MCPLKDTLGSRNIVADGISVQRDILLNLHRKHADSFIFNLLRRSFSMRLVAPIEPNSEMQPCTAITGRPHDKRADAVVCPHDDRMISLRF